MASRPTTKVCKCGNTMLVPLTSLNKKYCTSCHTYIDWYLDEGQKSPLTSIIGGRTEHLVLPKTTITNKTEGPQMQEFNIYSSYGVKIDNITDEQISTFLNLFTAVYGGKQNANLVKDFTALIRENTHPYIIVKFEVFGISMYLSYELQNFPAVDVESVMIAYTKELLSTAEDHIQEAASYSPKHVPTVQVSTAEAASEYVQVWNEIMKFAEQLRLKPIAGTRLENLVHILETVKAMLAIRTLH